MAGIYTPHTPFHKNTFRIFMLYPKFATCNFRIKNQLPFSITAIATDFIYANECSYEKALAFAYKFVKLKK